MTDLPAFPSISCYLSRDEVDDYLLRKLHLIPPGADFIPNLQFLQEFCRQCAYNLPYSNLHCMAVPPAERNRWRTARVDKERVRQQGLSGKGGMCYDNNVFLSWLLTGLGYQVAYILAEVFTHSVTQVALLVRLDDVDYIVNPSSGGRPIGPFAVPMDFEEESPVYRNSVWDMKFFKKVFNGKETIIGALHWSEDFGLKMPSPISVGEGWTPFLAFERRYYTLDEVIDVLSRPIDEVLSATLAKPFLYWTPKGKLRACWGRKLIWEDDEGVKHEKICGSMKELHEGILEMFRAAGWDDDYVGQGLQYCEFNWEKD